jgi:WD40 repeat protein
MYNYYITTSGSWGTPQDITPAAEINNTFGFIPSGGGYNKLYVTELDNGIRGLLDIIEIGPAPFFLSIPQHFFFDIVGFSASGTKYVPESTDDILVTERISLITDYTNNSAYFLTSESPAPIQYRITEIKTGGVLETIFDSDADGRILIASSKNIAIMLKESGQFYQLPSLTTLGNIGGTPSSVSYNLDDDDDCLLQGTGNNTNRYKYNIYTGQTLQYASGLSTGSGENTILSGQFVSVPSGFYYPVTFATSPTTFTYFAGRIIY